MLKQEQKSIDGSLSELKNKHYKQKDIKFKIDMSTIKTKISKSY